MDTWLRVLLYVVLMIAPTALFLGLWSGLNRMRDDELTRQALERADSSPARRTLAGRMMFGSGNQYERVDLDGLADADAGPSAAGGTSPTASSSRRRAATTTASAEQAGTVDPSDPVDSSRQDREDAADGAALREPVVCPACGAPNDPEFDRCVDCLTDL